MHAKLAHLSPEQVSELMDRYYHGNETVAVLIDAYKVDVRPSGLVALFPPVIHDDLFCPYCEGINLVTKRSSRNGGAGTHPVCPDCGHKSNSGCWCANCQKREKERRLTAEERKRQIINGCYAREIDFPFADELSLRDAVFLMALSRHSLTEDLKFITPFDVEPPFAPTYSYQNEIIKHLYAKGLVYISAESRTDAFVFDAAETHIEAYYPAKVLWEFLPAWDIESKRDYLKELNEIITGEWSDEWKADLADVWREIAKYECIEYFIHLLDQRGYRHEIGEKTHLVFETVLENFPVSRIFNLSWQAVRNVTDYIVRESVPDYHGKNIFIGAVQRQAEKAKAEGWDVRHSRRDFNCPQTVVSSTFFNLFLGLGDKAFETLPPKEKTDMALAS